MAPYVVLRGGLAFGTDRGGRPAKSLGFLEPAPPMLPPAPGVDVFGVRPPGVDLVFGVPHVPLLLDPAVFVPARAGALDVAPF